MNCEVTFDQFQTKIYKKRNIIWVAKDNNFIVDLSLCIYVEKDLKEILIGVSKKYCTFYVSFNNH